MRYTGVNRVRPRGVGTHVALRRRLRNYIEQHQSDLVDINKFGGADDYGRNDVVEAIIIINGKTFVFHIEGSDQSEPEQIKPRGALGVVHDETGMAVSAPVDAGTWERVEALVRFAAKVGANDGRS
jgi:hypothetical protein